MKSMVFFIGLVLIISIPLSCILAMENSEFFIKRLKDECPSEKKYNCQLCESIDWKETSTVCISLLYDLNESTVSLKLTLEEPDLSTEIIAVEDPIFVCGKIKKFPTWDPICINAFNLSYTEESFHGLVALGFCRIIVDSGKINCYKTPQEKVDFNVLAVGSTSTPAPIDTKPPERNSQKEAKDISSWIVPIIIVSLAVGIVVLVTFCWYRNYSRISPITDDVPLIGTEEMILL